MKLANMKIRNMKFIWLQIGDDYGNFVSEE